MAISRYTGCGVSSGPMASVKEGCAFKKLVFHHEVGHRFLILFFTFQKMYIFLSEVGHMFTATHNRETYPPEADPKGKAYLIQGSDKRTIDS